MQKVYKAEFVLGLIGSITGTVAFILSIIFGVAFGVLSVGFLIVPAIITSTLLLVAFILGFVGTSRFSHNDKSGGVLLVVAGGLSFIGIIVAFYAAWFSFLSMPLFFIGGIMALVRKPQAPPVQ